MGDGKKRVQETSARNKSEQLKQRVENKLYAATAIKVGKGDKLQAICCKVWLVEPDGYSRKTSLLIRKLEYKGNLF